MSVFVSHDGDNTEVYVTTARAKVTKIEERTSSANVQLEASYLQHPLNGWLNLSEEALDILRKAQESGEEVEVRIEAQRKPKIDKTIPIQEIRDSKSAKTDIIKKIACVNGVFTSEALTNPADDPDTGKPKSALNNAPRDKSASADSAGGGGSVANKGQVLDLLKGLSTSRDVSESILDALRAQALIAGATVQDIVNASTVDPQGQPSAQANSFASEAPPFKEYNSDGRLNLGGPSVAAGVGAHNYVYDKLSKSLNTEPNADTVEYFAALLLSMADVIQIGAYGQGFRVDRKASSHVRVRSCLFSVVDVNPLPVTDSGTIETPEVVNAWVKRIGGLARHNFVTGITLSQQFPSVKNLLGFIAGDGTVKEVTASSAQDAPEAVENNSGATTPDVTPEVGEARTEVAEPMSEPTVEEIVEQPAPQTPETKAVTPAAAPVVEETVETAPENSADELLRFEERLLPPGSINSSNAPSEELLSQFKEFVIEECGLKSKAEQVQVGKLLGATFGRAYSKASSIPEDDLADFLDFYVSTGTENFKAILNTL